MEFDIKVEVDMGYLWYPLGTKELLEKFSTDVYQQWGIIFYCYC
jgi:hypothetical protein